MTGRGIKASALACALALAPFLGACSRKAEEPPNAVNAPAGSDSRAQFLQLAGGAFSPVAGPSNFQARSPSPWTVQERVADLAFLGDTLWLAVNGHGLASVTPGDRPKTTAFYDPLLFPYRTITTLVPADDRLIVHLYFNATLNVTTSEDLRARGISLLSFSPKAEEPDYTIIVPPFQSAHPQWEAVGFAPLSPREALLEWKLSGDETRFAWTWLQLDERREASSSRQAFQRAMAYLPAEAGSVPPRVRRAIEAVTSELGGGIPGSSILYAVREREAALKMTWRSGSADRFVTVPVFVEGEESLALLPGGRLLRVGADAAISRMDLPALPEGFRYTDLARSGDWLVVPWEESRFTEVGASGVLLYLMGK